MVLEVQESLLVKKISHLVQNRWIRRLWYGMFGIYSYYLLLKVGPGREKKILATYLAGEHIKLPSILTREVHVDHHRITLSSFSLLGI